MAYGIADAGQLFRALFLRVHIGISARVDLDRLSAGRTARIDLVELGIDEQRHPDTGATQPGARSLNGRQMGFHVQASFSGELCAAFGNQTNVVRFDLQRDADHLGIHGTL